jgi:RsiW-degrading membrane proteinase PrsW (M82 family)
MPFWSVLGISLAAAVGYGWLIARHDRHDPEPWRMLMLAGMLGAGAGYASGWVADWLSKRLHVPLQSDWFPLLVIAPEEELLKFLPVLLLFFFSRHFNDPFDGLIYGVFVGLGYSTEEAIWYWWNFELGVFDVIARAVVAFPVHAMTTGIACYSLGLIRFRVRRAVWLTPVGLLTAMLLHGLWDYFAHDLDRWSVVVVFLLVVVVFGWMMAMGMGRSAKQFGEPTNAGSDRTVSNSH